MTGVLLVAAVAALVGGLVQSGVQRLHPLDRLREMRGTLLALLIALAGLLATILVQHPFPLVMVLVAWLVQFLVTWFREFGFLMVQPDEVFPGRFDKLVWALLLI